LKLLQLFSDDVMHYEREKAANLPPHPLIEFIAGIVEVVGHMVRETANGMLKLLCF